MKITPIKNIEFKDDVFICPKESGICISEFEMEFDEKIEFLEADHCECIHSLIFSKGKTLNIRLVTDKNEIDEFIIITFNASKFIETERMAQLDINQRNLKIRFIR